MTVAIPEGRTRGDRETPDPGPTIAGRSPGLVRVRRLVPHLRSDRLKG